MNIFISNDDVHNVHTNGLFVAEAFGNSRATIRINIPMKVLYRFLFVFTCVRLFGMDCVCSSSSLSSSFAFACCCCCYKYSLNSHTIRALIFPNKFIKTILGYNISFISETSSDFMVNILDLVFRSHWIACV